MDFRLGGELDGECRHVVLIISHGGGIESSHTKLLCMRNIVAFFIGAEKDIRIMNQDKPIDDTNSGDSSGPPQEEHRDFMAPPKVACGCVSACIAVALS